MNKPQLPFHCLRVERTTRFLCDAQMLNVMADGLPGIVAYYDVDLVCHFVNATVEAWTGAAPSAFVSRGLSEADRDFAAAAKPGIERALAGAHAEFEAEVDFAGGMVNVVRGFAYPDRDQNGRVLGCFVLLLDITRERAFEAQMKAARDEAMEAIRSKSRFLAAASHDLRQPLHAMTLFVSALSRRLNGGESGELVANLDNSLRSLRAMIDTLLDISKLDAGLVKPTLAPLALSDLFAALEPGFSAVARDRGLDFPHRPDRRHGRRRPHAGRAGDAQPASPTRSSSPAAAAWRSAAGAGAAGSAWRSPTPASASPPTDRRRCSRSSTATRRRPTAPTRASASACRSSSAWRR